MYIRFWEKFPDLVAGTTTRNNGNFAFNKSNPQSKNTLLNRNKLLSKLRFNQLFLLSQTHSDTVINADTSPPPQQGDALFTSHPQKLLGILTADCMPIFIYHPKQKIVGLVHSGRQGLQQQITEKTLLYIQKQHHIRLKDIHILIGPHICQKCYSLDSPILSSFGLTHNQKTLDMASFLTENLIQLGIPPVHIELSHYCTKCTLLDGKALFYSHRNGDSERILSFIGLF